MTNIFHKLLVTVGIALFSVSSSVYAFDLVGLRLDPNEPLDIEFIFDKGNDKNIEKADIERVVNYFLAGLTIPNADLWVNLSPYEKNRIISPRLGNTELGRDMLVQDSHLKNISAALTHPDTMLGQSYWNVAKTTLKDSFSKVCIVPSQAKLYESSKAVFIAESSMRSIAATDFYANRTAGLGSVKSGLAALADLITPQIDLKINNSPEFEDLRHIYSSLILASWFKQKLKDSFYNAYLNKQKIAGIDIVDARVKNDIYQSYIQSVQKGAYDIVKKEIDPKTDDLVKRRYFSGGLAFNQLEQSLAYESEALNLIKTYSSSSLEKIKVELKPDYLENRIKDIPINEWINTSLGTREQRIDIDNQYSGFAPSSYYTKLPDGSIKDILYYEISYPSYHTGPVVNRTEKEFYGENYENLLADGVIREIDGKGSIHGTLAYQVHDDLQVSNNGRKISAFAKVDDPRLPAIINNQRLDVSFEIMPDGMLEANYIMKNLNEDQITDFDMAAHFNFRVELAGVKGARENTVLHIPEAKFAYKTDEFLYPTGEVTWMGSEEAQSQGIDFRTANKIGLRNENNRLDTVYYLGDPGADGWHYASFYDEYSDLTRVIQTNATSIVAFADHNNEGALSVEPTTGPTNKIALLKILQAKYADALKSKDQASIDQLETIIEAAQGLKLNPGESKTLTVRIWVEQGNVDTVSLYGGLDMQDIAFDTAEGSGKFSFNPDFIFSGELAGITAKLERDLQTIEIEELLR